MYRLRRVGRYAQVGLVCAVLNNVMVMVMDRAGYHYAISVTVAFFTVMLVGYLLHAGYTFNVPHSLIGCLRFIGANLLGFPLSMAIMFLLCGGLKLHASLAMPIATALLFAWNFVLVRSMIDGREGRRSC